MIKAIKHLTFAVRDADKALEVYRNILGVTEAEVKDTQANYRVAKFRLGGVEFQLCQPLPGDTRFTEHLKAHGEGLEHICFEVDNIKSFVDQALAAGATLKECVACRVVGIHPHPEGYIAFLSPESVPAIWVEVMQVYGAEGKPGEVRDV